MKEGILTVPQRKVLAEMLIINHWNDCLWKAAKTKYDNYRNTLRLAHVREASKGAKELLDRLAATRQKVSDLREDESTIMADLSKRGFSVDSDGDIELRTSSPLYKTIEQRIDGQLGSFEEVVNLPFERARVKLWTVASPEEAERIIEPFLNFEVKQAK